MSESTDNYLKTIYSLETAKGVQATTNALAEKLNTKASSVTDMLKKLEGRGLVHYTKYHGTSLTTAGRKNALQIVRKHRLWEYFLVEKLDFKWDEVHDIAEQLEHIESAELIKRLDKFLGKPKFDPHGDPIPDGDGNLPAIGKTYSADDMKVGELYTISAVARSSGEFLEHLKKLKLSLGSHIKLLTRYSFDHSIEIESDRSKLHLSQVVASNLILQKVKKK